MLNLNRPVVFLDLETTGLDIAHDRIVEFGVCKMKPDGECRTHVERFNPGMPIPADATEKHGIKDEDVAPCPAFETRAKFIHASLTGCDLAGFNLINYDVPLLAEEFLRAGIEWDLEGVRIVDAGVIFKKHEERTLSAAVQFYCGREHVNAHGALSDAQATKDVLLSQIERYQDIGAEVGTLASASKFDGEYERVDLGGKFLRDREGRVVFGFGKHRHEPVDQHPDYVEWMLGKEFPVNTKRVGQRLLSELAAVGAK